MQRITTTDKAFANMITTILLTGSEIDTRNSITKRCRNLIATFSETPLMGIRKTAWKNAIREMEWFISGSSNIKDLHPSVHKWWIPWADRHGDIDNNYSKQFRHFGSEPYEVDQIKYVIDTLKDHPNSRRNVITTWHTYDMLSPDTPITNCHGTMIQCFVEPDDSVHMTMYQRSCDMVLGVPHNWIQYWALLQYLAHQSNRSVGSFTWIGGDCHIYKDHTGVANEIMNIGLNNQFEDKKEQVKLLYTPTSKDFKAEDFSLDGDYKPLLTTSAKMVV